MSYGGKNMAAEVIPDQIFMLILVIILAVVVIIVVSQWKKVKGFRKQTHYGKSNSIAC